MRPSSASSSRSVAAGERRHHLRRQVVRRRPEAAAGDDHVQALARLELDRSPQVLRAVADDRHVGELDAALAQPSGQPGAVAVGDDPRQDLGSGDDDAGARAHVQPARPLVIRCGLPPRAQGVADGVAALRDPVGLAVLADPRRGGAERDLEGAAAVACACAARPRACACRHGAPARVLHADVDLPRGEDADADRLGRRRLALALLGLRLLLGRRRRLDGRRRLLLVPAAAGDAEQVERAEQDEDAQDDDQAGPEPRRHAPGAALAAEVQRRRVQARRALEALLVLLDQQPGVELEVLGVGAQERLDERGAREELPLLALQRAQVLGADLRGGFDLRHVDPAPHARLAQGLADLGHWPRRG